MLASVLQILARQLAPPLMPLDSKNVMFSDRVAPQPKVTKTKKVAICSLRLAAGLGYERLLIFV